MCVCLPLFLSLYIYLMDPSLEACCQICVVELEMAPESRGHVGHDKQGSYSLFDTDLVSVLLGCNP